MSITDDSTGLSTTYTEQTVVAFTAGTLANIAACVTEVESKLRRGTLSSSTNPTSTQVQSWLIRAKEELAEVKNFTWKRRYATAATVASQYRYALPPDYNGGPTRLRDTTNDRYLTIDTEYLFDKTYPDVSAETANEPLYATIKNMELWLCPPPDGAYTLELEYERSGADNTTTDFSWLPELERWRCTDYATAEAFYSLHMWQEGSIYFSKWKDGLGKAIRADGKRKWKTMQYQMTDWNHGFKRK